ncbi:5-(carboxyamino)imidazole ribonucleotide synthase [Nannocystaceae bacterium ST9]
MPPTPALTPNRELRVGVFGAGQLGRMLGLAALRMGVEVRFLTPHDSGATRGVGETLVGDWQDPEVLRAFMAGCSALTVENEWVPLARAAELAEREFGLAIHPGPRVLARIGDKLIQKRHAEQAGIPLGPYRGCRAPADAERAAAELGYPVIVKRRRGSYDGYGNATARDATELRAAFERLAETGSEVDEGVLVEGFVGFARELAVLVARSIGGESVVYPIAFTEQQGHRCAAVEVPAAMSVEASARAGALGVAVADAFEIVGVCAIELFELPDGRLWFNELAPRPHNSGHYTIEACRTSQFENHLRAVLGWPLGDPGLVAPAAVMVNLLGEREGLVDAAALARALAIPGVAVHLYGKREVRPRRKMGHVTAIGDDLERLRSAAEAAAAAIRL